MKASDMKTRMWQMEAKLFGFITIHTQASINASGMVFKTVA